MEFAASFGLGLARKKNCSNSNCSKVSMATILVVEYSEPTEATAQKKWHGRDQPRV